MKLKQELPNKKKIRDILKLNNAEFMGVDHQIDTYFKVGFGRLKLREGNIENCLIYYERDDISGPKKSSVILYAHSSGPKLKEILAKSLGVLAVVDKHREIFFINNVKFHLDDVAGLGTFIEIEAIDKNGSVGNEKLLEQCNYYLTLLDVSNEDLVENSYSDLVKS